jgi:hypothetical protein
MNIKNVTEKELGLISTKGFISNTKGISVFSESSFSEDDEFHYRVRAYGNLLLDEELESLTFIHNGELVEMKVKN